MLSEEQIANWDRDGMLILPGFFDEAQLRDVDATMRRIWQRRDPRVVVDDMNTGRRCLLSALSEEEGRAHRFKTNDLFLTEASIREVALGGGMADVLAQLLGQVPVLCNSLNFDQGSSQGAHIDALYMTPITRGHLCAIWVALEDVAPEAGPLFFFRGSHRLPIHTFSDGSHHAIESEMAVWHANKDREVLEHGLRCETFLAKRGDVLIWSSELLHGGTPIQDPNKTRKSVVFHYFTKGDADAVGWKLEPLNGAFWIDRARQRVAEDPPEELPPAPAVPAVASVKPRPKAVTEAEVARLERRIRQLEEEVTRLRNDPLRVRLTARRVRKWLRARLRGPTRPTPAA